MTEIHFEMKNPGQVRVSIIDVSGRVVNTLVQENLDLVFISGNGEAEIKNGPQAFCLRPIENLQ